MNYKFFKKCAMTAVALMCVTTVSAQWTQVKELPACYAAYKTPNGNMLLSDYQFDYSGGIYISADEKTWTKTEVEDHCYNRLVTDGKYIYAIGLNACIARSGDEGKTWQIFSYAEAAAPVMDEGATDYTVAYDMCVHNGKLFICDFCGGGVMFSEDCGETWQRTEIKTMQYNYTDEESGETYVLADNLYQLVDFKGKLYAFGMYCVYEYVDSENDWILKRTDSNFMAEHAIINGELYVGRSCPNDDPKAPFLEKTKDFENWEYVPSPEGLISKNVRTMNSDENYVFVCMQNDGAYVLDVKSGKWYAIKDGYPEIYGPQGQVAYAAPTKTFRSGEYLYNVIFSPSTDMTTVSGLYKYPMNTIREVTAIEHVNADGNVSFGGKCLNIPAAGNAKVTIYDAAGKKVMDTVANGKIYLGSLNKGVYVFEVRYGGNTVKGKFAI